jgi:hypothetical protein
VADRERVGKFRTGEKKGTELQGILQEQYGNSQRITHQGAISHGTVDPPFLSFYGTWSKVRDLGLGVPKAVGDGQEQVWVSRNPTLSITREPPGGKNEERK